MVNEKPFCSECSCSGEALDLGHGESYQEKNWHCPLIAANICDTCCHDELGGGMGAPDTLMGMVRKTGKSAAEIHKICVDCSHGGKALEEPPQLISVKSEAGSMIDSGEEFQVKDAEFKEQWAQRLKRLKKRTKK